jgi:hypothetical protein
MHQQPIFYFTTTGLFLMHQQPAFLFLMQPATNFLISDHWFVCNAPATDWSVFDAASNHMPERKHRWHWCVLCKDDDMGAPVAVLM